MRAVVQRVRSASVTVEDDVVGEIGTGFLVLLGVATDDGDEDGTWMARKIAGLRVFPDEAGRMNLDLAAAAGEVLLVSQFTLQADCRRGNRPSFIAASRFSLPSILTRLLKLSGFLDHAMAASMTPMPLARKVWRISCSRCAGFSSGKQSAIFSSQIARRRLPKRYAKAPIPAPRRSCSE